MLRNNAKHAWAQSEEAKSAAAQVQRTRKVELQRRQQLKGDLEFFYSVMNPAKVADVADVLQLFGKDEERLNAQLREAYGLDLSASRKDICRRRGNVGVEEGHMPTNPLDLSAQWICRRRGRTFWDNGMVRTR